MAESAIPPENIAATNEKLLAEAEKLKAETEEIAARSAREAARGQLEMRKIEVEMRKLETEMANIEAVTRSSAFQSDVYGIQRDREQEKRKWELAEHRYHHVYHFTAPVKDTSVEHCMGELTLWTRTAGDEKPPLEIVFTSPGGTLIDGMALFDYIQQIRRQGFRVTTGALGMAASMAGILLQAGDIRYMSKESWLLLHEAQFGAIGKMGEIEDTVAWIKKIQEHILDIFAARSKLSRTVIKQRWRRTDWWLSAADALKAGFIDEVR